MTVHQAMRILHDVETRVEPTAAQAESAGAERSTPAEDETSWISNETSGSAAGQPGGIQRLVWARGHLHRIQPQSLSFAEREEITRLLILIRQDVNSLLDALSD